MSGTGPNPSEKIDLRHSVAWVTGASRGLGRAFALGLAEAGAAVGLTARTPTGLEDTRRAITANGGRAVTVRADVTDATAAASAHRTIERELGPVDILVNNAAVMAPTGRDWEVDPIAWWRTMEVNVLGPFLSWRAVLPSMLQRRRGRIITLSTSAVYKRYPFYSAYGASKAAVTHASASLAEATRPFGIAVFALSPGFVKTQMTEDLADSPVIREHLGEGIRKALDEGRVTLPRQAVDALLILASGRADALSGRHFDVSEDFSALIREATG
jgi:NAD(P)-dependent dehydrogenase (short-subunit alcohol dehydrogenase family)